MFDESCNKIGDFILDIIDNPNDAEILKVDYCLDEGGGITIVGVVIRKEKTLTIEFTIKGIYMNLKGFIKNIEVVLDESFESLMFKVHYIQKLLMDENVKNKITEFIDKTNKTK